MFGMWVLRMQTMALSSIAVNQERKRRPRRARLGVEFRTIGCEILADIQIEISVNSWKLGSEAQAEGWVERCLLEPFVYVWEWMYSPRTLSWKTLATGAGSLKSEQGNRVEKKGESMGRNSYLPVVLIPDRAIGPPCKQQCPTQQGGADGTEEAFSFWFLARENPPNTDDLRCWDSG